MSSQSNSRLLLEDFPAEVEVEVEVEISRLRH